MPFPIAAAVAAAGAAAAASSGYLNYRAQLKKLNWDKSVQTQAWQREDSSVQRRVADLRAAGLSPVLAAGQGASAGPVVPTQAPQLDVNPIAIALNAIQQQAQISQTYAQTKLADAQKEQALANARSANVRASTDAYDLQKSKDVGTSTKPGVVGQVIRDLFGFSKDSNIVEGANQAIRNKQEIEKQNSINQFYQERNNRNKINPKNSYDYNNRNYETENQQQGYRKYLKQK